MRIALVHGGYAQRGGEDAVVELEAELLRKAGCEVRQLRFESPAAGGLAARARAAREARRSRRAARRLARFLDAGPVDLVHVHNFFPLPTPGVHELLAERDLPVVQTLHNYRLLCARGDLLRGDRPCEDCVSRGPWNAVRHGCWRGSRLATAVWADAVSHHRRRRTWQRCVDRFVAPSAFARRKLVAGGIEAERIEVVPNPVRDPGEPAAPGRGGVYVGRLSAEKGVGLLVRAWRTLGDVPLAIVGSGPEESTLRAEAAGLPGIRFTGELPPEAVADELARAGFLVAPSLCYETFGLAAAEALAAGRPVVVPGGGALAELSADGRTGVRFASGDADALAAACRALAGDPARAAELGREARRWFEDELAPGRHAERLLALFGRVLAERGARPRAPGAGRPPRRLRRLGRALRGAPRTPSLLAMTLGPDDVALVREWLDDRSHWNDVEPVEIYERGFAEWNGSAHAFSFGAGRAALSAAIGALGLGPGDEVVAPAFTCVAVPNAFAFAGVDVAWADIELETFGPDVASVEAAIGPRTRAVLLQHLFGLASRDTHEILALARSRGLRVIEDCAHGTGVRLDERRLGSFGDVGIYSTEHSKVMSTVHGGLAVCEDPELARRLHEIQARAPRASEEEVARWLANVLYDYHRHVAPERAESRAIVRALAPLAYRSVGPEEAVGRRPARYGLVLPPPLAALGLHQLAKVDRVNARRREAAARWDAWCERAGYARPRVLEGSEPVYLRYPVVVEPERKRELGWALDELGVRPGVWFTTPTHPVERPDPRPELFPNAARAVAGCINLPTLF